MCHQFWFLGVHNLQAVYQYTTSMHTSSTSRSASVHARARVRAARGARRVRAAVVRHARLSSASHYISVLANSELAQPSLHLCSDLPTTATAGGRQTICRNH
eukprot:COSAG02_NODE_7243_length_3099_cov_7.936667_1_plen_102_part_00